MKGPFEDLGQASMQTLLSLRDIGRDDLRRTLEHEQNLREMLASVEKEIKSRGQSQEG